MTTGERGEWFYFYSRKCSKSHTGHEDGHPSLACVEPISLALGAALAGGARPVVVAGRPRRRSCAAM